MLIPSDDEIERGRQNADLKLIFMLALYRRAWRQLRARVRRGMPGRIAFELAASRILNEQFNWRPK